MAHAAIVDAHCHIGADLSPVGTDLAAIASDALPDVLVDAGTYGPANVEPFLDSVADCSDRHGVKIRVLVNVAARGLDRPEEITEPSDFVPEEAARIARRYPALVCGLKVRAVLPALEMFGEALIGRSVEAAENAGVPVVVHFGQQRGEASEEAMMTPNLLNILRAGDVATHVYTSMPGGIFGTGSAFEAAQRARGRGVLFDVGHGGFNFDIGVARLAAGRYFPPDLIGSDVTSATSSWLSLPAAMEAVAAAGFEPATVIEAVTTGAANWLAEDFESGGRSIAIEPDGSTVRRDSRGAPYQCPYRFRFN